MGVFAVPIKVRNWQNQFLPPEEQRQEVSCDALVDTGAVQLALPAELIQRLRLKQTRAIGAFTADGRRAEFRVFGMAEVEVKGHSCAGEVIELPHGSRPLLGALQLEEMDWHVSPLKQELVPNPESPNEPLLPMCVS
jgi:clan AA aspartic protease